MPNNDRLLLPSPPQASLPLERKLAVDPAVLARSGIVSEDELVRTGVKPILVAARASGERTPASLRRGRHASGVLARNGKVWFTNIPHLWLLEDKNGDGKADTKQSLASGFGVRVKGQLLRIP